MNLALTTVLAGAVLLLSGCAALAPTIGAPPSRGAPRELVVLVHGMGRTKLSMMPLQRALERDGYRVLNFGYSSYGPSIAGIGGRLGRAVDKALEQEDAPRVHFVGHSLGNIVIRAMIAHARPARLGRVVMLTPPNQGAHAAERMSPLVGWLMPPIRELRPDGGTVTAMAPPDRVEFAILAGDTDRKVRFNETRLIGAAAHVVVRSGHTFVMVRPRVIRLVGQFIATGRLAPETG